MQVERLTLYKILQVLAWLSRLTTSILLVLPWRSPSRDYLHISAYPSSHRVSTYCSISLLVELLVCYPFTRPWTVNANKYRYSHRRSLSCIYNGLPQSASLKRPLCVIHPSHRLIAHVPLPCPLCQSTTSQTFSLPSHFPLNRSYPLSTRYLVSLPSRHPPLPRLRKDPQSKSMKSQTKMPWIGLRPTRHPSRSRTR